MSEHIVKVLEAKYITHDVRRFVLEKPKGYSFIPGQATDVSINRPEWRNGLRPFTFTSLNEWDHLEFMIKTYPERHGVTNRLRQINAWDELILHDVFGAINYKGPGVFIAGGAGITPFMVIFRDLHKKDELTGNKLFYSNKTSSDVIMSAELVQMLRNDFIRIFTREITDGVPGKRIDKDYLLNNITDFSVNFYVCGPDSFVTDITKLLTEMGAKTESLVVEQ